MGKHEWFRWVVVAVLAIAAGGVASAFLEAWLAGAVGVGVGLGASLVLIKWEDRHAPDFVEVFERGLK